MMPCSPRPFRPGSPYPSPWTRKPPGMKNGPDLDPSKSVSASECAEALRFLPHGPEFRFLDRVLSLDPGRSGTGEYRVRGDEPFLLGHFPGNPIFPGVLVVEAAAQLAGLVGQSDPTIAPL